MTFLTYLFLQTDSLQTTTDTIDDGQAFAILSTIGTIGFLIGLGFYFIPSIIALIRKKRNKVAIIALNFFLGWSLIGWVVSLVWALKKDSQPNIVQVNNHNSFKQ